MKLTTVRVFIVLTWGIFILVLFTGLEIFARYRQGYLIKEFTLVKKNFSELDRMRIWNKKAYEQNPDYFREWPIPLEFFASDSPNPFYLYKPNLKMTNKNNKLVPAQDGDEIFYSINSFGLKSPEVSKEKTEDKIRIVALGASTTEGSSSNGNAYPQQLEQILKTQGYNVEVVNAGHGAYKIEDILAFYQSQIVSLKPDILIFYEGSLNDIKPQVQEWLREQWGGEYNWPDKYPKWFQFAHKYSALFVFASKVVGIDKKDTAFLHSFDSGLPKPALAHYQKTVNELIRVSGENKTIPVLATFVTVAHDDVQISYEEKPFIWDSLKLRLFPLSAGEIETIHTAYNNVLKEIAKQQSIPVIDTTSLFPKDSKYFIDYVHLTPEGDKLLALYIADFLVKDVLPNYSDTND